MTNQKVLMTGAAGYVGTLLLDRLAPRYDWLLTDLHAPVRDYQLPFVAADINDLTAMTQLCRRVETVLHLAASARQDHDWENILSANLSGVRQVFEAARLAGCRRVVFASTLTLLDGVLENQDAGRRLTPDAPLAPGTLYAASKA